MMPRIRRSKSTASRRNTPSALSDSNQLATEVLCLRCEQLKLSATGFRQTLLACHCTSYSPTRRYC